MSSVLVAVFQLWFISCVHSQGEWKDITKGLKPKTKDIVEKCEKDTVHQVFEHETRCDKESTFLNTLPEFIKLHPDYLSYILYPTAMEHFVETKRALSDATVKQQQDIVTDSEVQYHLGVTNGGKTLLIFFPGTEIDMKLKFWDQPDVEIDLSAKHRKITLPKIIDERFHYNRPDDDNWEQSGKMSAEELARSKINVLRVHEGIYNRMHDREIQTALQKDLGYLYSGHYEMDPIAWSLFVATPEMKKVEPILIAHGFQQQTIVESVAFQYTNPEATHLLSSQWAKFIKDDRVTKKDIVLVTEQIRALQKKVLKGAHGETGVKTTKVENLIISGHSLGAAYAVLFYLLLYGHPSMLQAEGYNVLPKSVKQVTVIPFAAPSVVYHADIQRISADVLARVTNIWNYDDPVPLLLNGVRHELTEGVSFSSLHKRLTDEALIELGVNQPIGNVMIMFKDKQRIRDGERYDESKDDNVWFKLIPWKKVNMWGSDDLKDNIYYINYGATCLWESRFGGALGAIPGAHKQHPFNRYKERIYESCLLGYLQKHSDYFREQTLRELKEEFEPKEWKKILFGWVKHGHDGDSARLEYGENEYNPIKQYTDHDDSYIFPLILCLCVALLMICMCLFPLGIWWGYVVLPCVEWSKFKRYLAFAW